MLESWLGAIKVVQIRQVLNFTRHDFFGSDYLRKLSFAAIAKSAFAIPEARDDTDFHGMANVARRSRRRELNRSCQFSPSE
jgi:hypothetical protein